MGKFIYESSVSVEFDDRVLLHLQTVISTKLRRGEPFAFRWKDDASLGGGRTSIWVHPSCALVYKYYGGRVAELNRTWLEALMLTANSPSGLYVVPEPPDQPESDEISEDAASA